jgi:pSer/pThr/pTyr-binding forkhead associated (FHA) protein
VIDLALLAGRLLLLALLYLFLFAAIRAGIGLVSEQRTKRSGALTIRVAQGPSELKGVLLPLTSPVVIGRSPGADIVIGDDFVSGRHARLTPSGSDVVVEDLGSTNGTLLNGQKIAMPMVVKSGDVIDIGAVRLEVGRS